MPNEFKLLIGFVVNLIANLTNVKGFFVLFCELHKWAHVSDVSGAGFCMGVVQRNSGQNGETPRT